MRQMFDYAELPLREIAERYRRGESWRTLARAYACPDDKTLARYVTEHVPDLAVRDHAESQRMRRNREGARRSTVKKKRAWWER